MNQQGCWFNSKIKKQEKMNTPDTTKKPLGFNIINSNGEKTLEFCLSSNYHDLNKFYRNLKKILELTSPISYDKAHLRIMDEGRSDAKPVSDYHWEIYRTKKFGLMMMRYWYKSGDSSSSYKALHFYEGEVKGGELYKLYVTFFLESMKTDTLMAIEFKMENASNQ